MTRDQVVNVGARHPRAAVLAFHILLPLYLLGYGFEGLRAGWRLFVNDRRYFMGAAGAVLSFRRGQNPEPSEPR